jgi:dethiobiotin synthetase
VCDARFTQDKTFVAGLFITGTGTEVGKTYVAAMLARALAGQGEKVGVYKPVASGCSASDDGQLTCEDAMQLWQAAGRPGSLAAVCPQRFTAPLAPPRAAAEEGRQVDPLLLRQGFEPWRRNSTVVLVEGAGGLLSPLSDADDNATLAADLGLPLLVVVANELGAINAARQTVLAARTLLPQLALVGIVLNQVAARPGDASLASNPEEISRWCETPIVATVGFGAETFAKGGNWLELCRTQP